MSSVFLKSIKEQEEIKKQRAEQRALEIKEAKEQARLARQQLKREKVHDHLQKKLDKIKAQNEVAKLKNKSLTIREKNAIIREKNHNIKVAQYKEAVANIYQREADKGKQIVADIKRARMELGAIQKERMDFLMSQMAPLIVRGGPSRSTTYKMHAKDLHCQIFALTQRLRLMRLRYESEAINVRVLQFEVKQLRQKISDYVLKITTITKGLPMGKIVLMEIKKHNKIFKELCDKHVIQLKPVKNDFPEYFMPLSRTEADILRDLNLPLSPVRVKEPPRCELLM